MAHDSVYGSNIQQGIIMVCTPDLYLQEFRFQGHELREWKHKFLKRVDEYYKIVRDPTINELVEIKSEKELLRKFEGDKIEE